jgi:hypothetical protein
MIIVWFFDGRVDASALIQLSNGAVKLAFQSDASFQILGTDRAVSISDHNGEQTYSSLVYTPLLRLEIEAGQDHDG